MGRNEELKQEIENLNKKIELTTVSNSELSKMKNELEKELIVLRSRLSRVLIAHPEMSSTQELPLPPGGLEELKSMQKANIEQMVQMRIQQAILKGEPCPLMRGYSQEVIKAGLVTPNEEKKKISYSYSAASGTIYRIGAKDGKINFSSCSLPAIRIEQSPSETKKEGYISGIDSSKSSISVTQRAAMFSHKNETPIGQMNSPTSASSARSEKPGNNKAGHFM